MDLRNGDMRFWYGNRCASFARKSPFDSNNGHTSFAAVVCTRLKSMIISRVDINPADLRIDTYRSSGAGGQPRLTLTDSAVRVAHQPTGDWRLARQNERSQHAGQRHRQ